MPPRISAAKQITLMGLSFYGDPFDTHAGWDADNQIGRLWKRLFQTLSRYPRLAGLLQPGCASYEVHIYNEETRQKGLFEVFAGLEVDLAQAGEIPIDLCIKVLPLTPYAVFTFHGQQINSDWETILQDWLASSSYTSPYAYNFQYYDERFKGVDRLEESTLDVYLPIREIG